MATIFAKRSCLFFLVVLCSCSQSECRQSKFFSKYVTIPGSINNPKKDISYYLSSPSPAPAPISQISSVPATAPAPAPLSVDYGPAPATAPASIGAIYGNPPAPASVESAESSYYGLYAKGTSTNDFSSQQEEFSNEELSSENPEGLNNKEFRRYSNGYLSNNNAFWTSNHKSYYYNTNYGSGYRSEPQGMSDTRLLDNGKYYYDVEHKKYSLSRRESNYNDEEGYNYGNYNNNSKYEFDSMEEYEKQDNKGYPADVQQDFIP